jgi:hypothetical protein
MEENSHIWIEIVGNHQGGGRDQDSEDIRKGFSLRQLYIWVQKVQDMTLCKESAIALY